jgi:high frequency lysogenization protein
MSFTEQTLTLAAICQSAALVQTLSRTGTIDNDELAIMLRSVLETSPKCTLAVYGDCYQNLSRGFQVITDHLGSDAKQKDPELTRYIVSLIALERRLTKQPKLLAELAKRITQIDRQLQHFELTDETIIASIASIYSDIISPLSSKIQIAGEPAILKQLPNQHKIRALLLAGVRAAVLWRQVGGKRRTILFSRSKLLECANQLLHSS